MMRGFCQRGFCLEGAYVLTLDGVMYGGGFVRGSFVQRGFCPTFLIQCHGRTT